MIIDRAGSLVYNHMKVLADMSATFLSNAKNGIGKMHNVITDQSFTEH